MSKDTIMVYADLNDRDLDLILCLIEKEMDSHNDTTTGIEDEHGIELFSAEEVGEAWEKLKAAEDRMDSKTSRQAKPAFEAWVEPEPVIDMALPETRDFAAG